MGRPLVGSAAFKAYLHIEEWPKVNDLNQRRSVKTGGAGSSDCSSKFGSTRAVLPQSLSTKIAERQSTFGTFLPDCHQSTRLHDKPINRD